MVILGLGSNLGDRLENCRNAVAALKKVPGIVIQQISPLYLSDALLPENGSAQWGLPYFNCALRCEISLTPHELLQKIKLIETELGRQPAEDWAPRPIDIDILAWDNLIFHDEKLQIPHEELLSRPFALWPLADLVPRWIHPLKNATAEQLSAEWGSRFNGQAPLHTRQILHRIDTSRLVGILNTTPDSFSDGGKFQQIEYAVQHANKLVEDGAEIIDIGAEASGPSAKPLTAEEEWQRLEPILAEILAQRSEWLLKPKISIDTRRSEIAKKALALGVDWINDVSGLTQPDMREIIANSHCNIVIMHQLGIPANPNITLPLASDPVALVYEWAEQTLNSLEKSAINLNRVILDLGIGFGKTASQSFELIKHIAAFHPLKTPLLIGHSRKSFLTLFTDKPPTERDIETQALSLFLSNQNTDYLRLHNIEHCSRSFNIVGHVCPTYFL